jgi:hypothetical protein
MERRASPPVRREAPQILIPLTQTHSKQSPPTLRLSPHPRIRHWVAHKSRPYGIQQHVLDLVPKLFFLSKRTIKRFLLPDRTPMSKLFVDAMGRRALNRLQDLGETDLSIHVSQWVQCNMHVIWHDHQCQQLEQLAIPTQENIQHYLASAAG